MRQESDQVREGMAAIVQEKFEIGASRGYHLGVLLFVARPGHEWEQITIAPDANTRAIAAAISRHRAQGRSHQLDYYVYTQHAKVSGVGEGVAVTVECVGSEPFTMFAPRRGDVLGPWQREVRDSVLLAD